jgi:hypothetical protein
MEFVVKVEWNWGGTKRIHTSSASPILEVLESHGFSGLDNSALLIAHRGRLINPMFTFNYHKIQSGDRLICLLKRHPDKPQSDQFQDVLSPTKRGVCQVTPVTDPGEAQRRGEIARLNDLSFSGCEATPDLPIVMRDLLRQQEEQNMARETFVRSTVVTGAMAMSETPLPNFFQPDRVCKYSGKYAFGKDISDQPRCPSHLDAVKKPHDGL